MAMRGRGPPPPPGAPPGASLFGWVPAEWQAAYDDADIVCTACGNGDEARGNLILLCDGPNCTNAYHMQCLRPPMLRQPAKHREWFCPQCKEAAKRAVATPRRAAPSRGDGGSGKATGGSATSEYEQQRLANIASNQQKLRELGLAN